MGTPKDSLAYEQYNLSNSTWITNKNAYGFVGKTLVSMTSTEKAIIKVQLVNTLFSLVLDSDIHARRGTHKIYGSVKCSKTS